MAVESPNGRGDGRLMTGLAPSHKPSSFPPLFPKSMNGMTGTSAVVQLFKTLPEVINQIIGTQCLPEQFEPPVGTDPTHVSPEETGIEDTNK